MTEGLLQQAEWVRVETMLGLDSSAQTARGQYFTPELAAELVACLPRLTKNDRIRVLDPGAGSGMLTAAIVERICREQSATAVEVTAVEVDPQLIPALQKTAAACEVYAAQAGVQVVVNVVQADLIARQTGLDAQLDNAFDLVVMNPPYKKLSALSWQRRALAARGWDTGNLYAAFVALGVESLKPGGQLVAITPRSFANGPYFERFRKRLLDQAVIDRVHTFESRSTVFADTGVLQENIVFCVTRGGLPTTVTITSSRDHTDGVNTRQIAYNDLVLPDDSHRFIRIATDGNDDEATRLMLTLPCSLDSLALRVSTGKVVDFRARDNLQNAPTPDSVPLVYPGNLCAGRVQWPRAIGKAQGFRLLHAADAKALWPSGYYVVVKRFSAKEERRRIVAAVWDPTQHGDQPVAFENHLNVFHASGQGFDRELAWGLCAWLNSSVVDRYFRTFSGHTQVNATDLRSLNYLDGDKLRDLGSQLDDLPVQRELDHLVGLVTSEMVDA
ncbi:MAG: Eco57I restriction-modification methylase domain-containing protein [Bifidobacteriaceae bacterium]|jgi:adenine-specific DNA-methyltransferase|nr:Eco57I restriction-modification methylase domain-containing protein [Bifidobacteriaceae bacterium]